MNSAAPRAGRRRATLVAVTVALLGFTGPAWPVAAAQDGRPPGQPPPVNPAALPTPAEVNTLPYTVDNAVTRQLGPVEQMTTCVHRPTGGEVDVEAEPPNQQRLRIRDAHQFATGRGQVVAVIDSGVNQHPRLAGRLIDGGDYIENRSGLFDCDGHGTAVAGLIAAAPDPATRFVGVAPAAEILSIRQGSSFYSVPLQLLRTGQQLRNTIAGDTVSMARAVVRAVTLGATVINISEAACFDAKPNQVNAPDLQAAVRHAVDSDVVVVVAAANVGDRCEQNLSGQVSTISSPGWFGQDVLTVAATDGSGEPAPFSMRGPWVDVAAPGTGAVSLDVAGSGLTTALVDAGGERSTIDGTSFATPYVSGLAALVRERFPHLNAREVMHRIEQTAQRAAGSGGRSEELGYGMIDPVGALTRVLPEEQGIAPEPAAPARLHDFAVPEPDNPMARTVALIGAAAAVGLLGLTLMVVHSIRRYRGNPRS